MSSMSCWVSGILSSSSLTFFATLRRMGSGSSTMRRTYANLTPWGGLERAGLQYVLRQIVFFDDVGEARLHVAAVDRHVAAALRGVERHAFEHALQHRVEPAR